MAEEQKQIVVEESDEKNKINMLSNIRDKIRSYPKFCIALAVILVLVILIIVLAATDKLEQVINDIGSAIKEFGSREISPDQSELKNP